MFLDFDYHFAHFEVKGVCFAFIFDDLGVLAHMKLYSEFFTACRALLEEFLFQVLPGSVLPGLSISLAQFYFSLSHQLISNAFHVSFLIPRKRLPSIQWSTPTESFDPIMLKEDLIDSIWFHIGLIDLLPCCSDSSLKYDAQLTIWKIFHYTFGYLCSVLAELWLWNF